MSKPLHALINSGLMVGCLLILNSSLKPSLKFPLVLVLGIGAQRQAQKQELLVKHYQQSFQTMATTSLAELQSGLVWIKGYLPEPQADRPKGTLQRIALDGWREISRGNNPVPTLYSQFKRQYIAFAANKREGKTSAAHYGLSLWMESEPDLLLYVFDPNFGMNDDLKFAPTWLGIPELDALPDEEIRTGAFKGKAKDLEPFIDVAIALLNQRIESRSRSPSVLIGIDELTNLLPQLDEKSRDRTISKLNTLVTQGDKHGIYVWIILHTITKEETCLDRVFLRQFHLVIGVELSQDRTVLSNAPRLLPPKAIAHGQEQYRLHGLRAGFITSLPVADGFLPTPPLPDGLVGLERDWGDTPETRLQKLFRERLQQQSVVEAIHLYRAGQLPVRQGEKPKHQLFRLAWGYPISGRRQAELKILNRHLDELAIAAETALSDAPNGNGHHPTLIT
jgi:hypothetical protein